MSEEFPTNGIRMIGAFSEEAQRAGLLKKSTASNLRRRRYSLELLNLAAQRATEIGLAAASFETGVGKSVIETHIYATRIAKQNKGQAAIRGAKSKYPIELLREVARRALEMHQLTGFPTKKCFANIGGLLGANGLSVYSLYTRGLFKM